MIDNLYDLSEENEFDSEIFNIKIFFSDWRAYRAHYKILLGEKSMASKKETLLCILEILRKYSDSDHLMTPKDIKAKLKTIYQLEVKDSRTIWDDIEILRDSYGYDIPKYGEKGDGYCFIKSADKDLMATQVQLLTDAINAFPFVSEDETEEICKILWEQLNIYERDLIKYMPVSKPNVKTTEIDLAGTMEELALAIKEQVKVDFEYYMYGIDKKLHKREKASGKDYYHVNPYGLLYSGDHYYLACTFYDPDHPSTDIRLSGLI